MPRVDYVPEQDRVDVISQIDAVMAGMHSTSADVIEGFALIVSAVRINTCTERPS